MKSVRQIKKTARDDFQVPIGYYVLWESGRVDVAKARVRSDITALSGPHGNRRSHWEQI